MQESRRLRGLFHRCHGAGRALALEGHAGVDQRNMPEGSRQESASLVSVLTGEWLDAIGSPVEKPLERTLGQEMHNDQA